ncbi:Guanylate cyclase 32E [Armadillidium vulgare]|nr:Guanylate cyclase 32E [Armadillidium vulgare]
MYDCSMKHSIIFLIIGLIALINGIPLNHKEERIFEPFREGILIKKIDNVHKFADKSGDFDEFNKDDKFEYVKTEGEEDEIFKEDILLKGSLSDEFVDEKHFEEEEVKEHFANEAAVEEFEEKIPHQNSDDKILEKLDDPIETDQTEVDDLKLQDKIKNVEYAEDEIREVEATYHEEPEEKYQDLGKRENFYPRHSYEAPQRINSLFFFGPVSDKELTSSRFLIPTFQFLQPEIKPFSAKPINSFFVEKLKSLQESVKSLLTTLEGGKNKREEAKESEKGKQKKPELASGK